MRFALDKDLALKLTVSDDMTTVDVRLDPIFEAGPPHVLFRARVSLQPETEPFMGFSIWRTYLEQVTTQLHCSPMQVLRRSALPGEIRR